MKSTKTVTITLESLRAENFGRPDAPVYKPLRRISVFLSYLCIRLGVSPNVITLLGLVSIGVAVVFLVSGNVLLWKLAGGMILLAYLLDCMDGEVARGSQKTSILGTQLEHIGHWLTIGFLQAGAAIGAYRATHQEVLVLLGYLSVIGWYSFYFLYLQLRMWIPSSARFRLLRLWSKNLYKIMPLDENLLIVSAFIGYTTVYIWVSGLLSITLFCVTISMYFAYQHIEEKAEHPAQLKSEDKNLEEKVPDPK